LDGTPRATNDNSFSVLPDIVRSTTPVKQEIIEVARSKKSSLLPNDSRKNKNGMKYYKVQYPNVSPVNLTKSSRKVEAIKDHTDQKSNDQNSEITPKASQPSYSLMDSAKGRNTGDSIVETPKGKNRDTEQSIKECFMEVIGQPDPNTQEPGLALVPINKFQMAHPLFKKLSVDATTCLLSVGKVLMLENQVLYNREEEHGEKFYLVIFGWLQLSRNFMHTDKLAKFGAGSFIGANWMYDGGSQN
jgi:hypothetical protein